MNGKLWKWYDNYDPEEWAESKNAEIAIWNTEARDEQWYRFSTDTVKGYVNTDDVAKWIYAVSQSSNYEELEDMINKLNLSDND
jgi:hypothetical protein